MGAQEMVSGTWVCWVLEMTQNNGHGVVSEGTYLQAGIYKRVKQDLDHVPVF